jgi:hypothetical protein
MFLSMVLTGLRIGDREVRSFSDMKILLKNNSEEDSPPQVASRGRAGQLPGLGILLVKT